MRVSLLFDATLGGIYADVQLGEILKLADIQLAADLPGQRDSGHPVRATLSRGPRNTDTRLWRQPVLHISPGPCYTTI